MNRGWRLGAALVASALLALSAPTASAAERPRPATRQPVPAAQPIGEPVPPVAGAQSLLSLRITSLTPRVVTAGTPAVTIEGRVTNTGDRRIDGLRVRLQRGEAIDSDKALRDVAGQKTDAASGPFQEISKSLEPEDSAEFSISLPVTAGLKINEPGVYPLLVNVNGRPDFGDQARLAAVSIPLPVLSLPGTQATPKPSPPGVTMIWPLLDEQPRRLPTTDRGTVLADDELADSLAAGGRLFSLVAAVRAATESDTELLRSLCFAVDPDLLETVSLMTEGYQVRTAGGQLVPGAGEDAATDWLIQVQGLTRGQCVVAVPYADADLVALSRAGAVELAQLALAGSATVARLLDPVQPLKDVYWPAGGTFDQRTLVDLANLGQATVLVDPAHLELVEGVAPYVVNGTQTANPVRAVPVDSLVSDALASPTSTSPTLDGGAEVDTGGSVQNGMAALVYRAAFDGRRGGQVLITPPRRWDVTSVELQEFLGLARDLLDNGFTTPVTLDQTVNFPNGGTAGSISFTTADAAQEIPTQVTAEVMRINATKQDMLDSMADDNTNTVNPNELLAPIQESLLRGVSTAWRGRTQEAAEAVAHVDGQLDALRDLVVVRNPARPLSLASGDSPIPVSIYNGLPVTIVVRVTLSSVPGLRAETIQDVRVPPLSSAPRVIPTEVSRSGRFSVDVRLTTPGGTSLGEPVRLELNSTSYGIISVALTGTAGAVLVLLVGFRIIRRVRAAKATEARGEEIVDS